MKYTLLLAVFLVAGCDLITEYPCGLDCTAGYCRCVPHDGSTDQFWVRASVDFTVQFNRCDCTVSRRVRSIGYPIPSDPAMGECFAEVDGDLGDNCEMSRDQNSGYSPCIRVVEFGGSVACGSPP